MEPNDNPARTTAAQPNQPAYQRLLIRPAPVGFLSKFRHLGPGFILSAAIVGSGELIATTALGAKAGFVAFWVILVSCVMKVALQLEFGKNAIYSGLPTMQSLNQLPGFRMGKAHWTLWFWLALQGLKILQVGGIVGGVAIVLHMAFPVVSIAWWAVISSAVTAVLVFQGRYGWVEKGSLVMIMVFTALILLSLLLLQKTQYAISLSQLAEGLQGKLPPATVAVAMGAFGITGIGGDEIMYYGYWCIEKGYATYTGPQEQSEAWVERARGWIRVMYLDAFCSMVIYTIVTAAFYLLGASLLHEQGQIPEGYAMVETLSRLFTVTLGPGAKIVFLIGAFFVLYSTLFTATASWSLLYADALGQFGWAPVQPASRKRLVSVLSWFFPALWCVLFLWLQVPVRMVLLGGIATSLLLLVVGWAAWQFRYRQLPKLLKPSLFYDVWFWISILTITAVGVYGIWQLI